jgi:hypothetical protein
MQTLKNAIKELEQLKDRLYSLERLQKSKITNNNILYISTSNLSSVSFLHDDPNLYIYDELLETSITVIKSKIKPLEDRLNLISELLK